MWYHLALRPTEFALLGVNMSRKQHVLVTIADSSMDVTRLKMMESKQW